METVTYFELSEIELIPFSLVDPSGENIVTALAATAVVAVPIVCKMYQEFAKLNQVVENVQNAQQTINQIQDPWQKHVLSAELQVHGLKEAQGHVEKLANTNVEVYNALPNLVSGESVIKAADSLLNPRNYLKDAITNIPSTAPESHDSKPDSSSNLKSFMESIGAKKNE